MVQGARRSPYVRWFDEVGLDDVAEVGGKNASLGEMIRELSSSGVAVPDGFAVTAEAYRVFLQHASLDRSIPQMLAGLDTRDVDALRDHGFRVRHAILSLPFPPALEDAILEAYDVLSEGSSGPVDVAVRSSATAEDLPDASFAGQQESYLNVRGRVALLETCKRCFASLFTDRAISYRAERGFDTSRVALSIGVQRMVRSDRGVSGVMFTVDTETGFRNAVLINAAYGLGENVVQGTVNPDEYTVFKTTLKRNARPILEKKLGSKELRMVYDVGGGKGVKNLAVPMEERNRFALEDDEILSLAHTACIIEEHYSAKRGRPTPMDIEWAKDGITGELFVVQARPETVQSRRHVGVIHIYHLHERSPVLACGRSIGDKIGSGRVRVIQSVARLGEFQDGEVLVAESTDPDWEPVMKKAAAIVTDRGSRTCHAAIVARELGLPAVVGAEDATARLGEGQLVTVSCAEGETGNVYAGKLAFDVERIDVESLPRPRTQVMLNVGDPREAFRLAQLPHDGVGLARLEFIINALVRVHPMALVHYDEIEDLGVRAQIDELTRGYADRTQYFVDRLAQGVAKIAAAFHPKDVIVRLSDFKSNEYANLVGGSRFEPSEANPMLGFRGASRYDHPRYRDGFALECRALAKVRDEMGLHNVKLMVPFCRTPDEGRRVQLEMEKHGLRRGRNGLEIYVMCEVPSNVVRAADFAEIFDGFSIGSNDLTQLVLGVDRDSEILAPIFDERDPAVMDMIASVIATAKRLGRKIGICGQAPSDYPEFAEFLVECGIDSVSLTPDTVLKTTLRILEKEKAQHS